MKLFLKNIILFIIPLLLINLCFYTIVYSLYFKNYENVDLNYKTYLLADSHGTQLIKKDSINSFYNFSAPSDSYNDMLHKLEYLIKYSSIKTLIITVDDHTLSKYRETKNNEDRSIYFKNNDDIKGFYKLFKKKYINRYFPLLSPKGRDIVEMYFFKDKKKKNYKNWINISKKSRTERCKIRIDYQFQTKEKSKILSQSLQEIIKLCVDNNIRIYGVMFPLVSEYLKEQGDKTYGAKELFKTRSIKILDFKKSYIEREDYFFNEDHLNKIGGAVLSKEIFKNIKSL